MKVSIQIGQVITIEYFCPRLLMLAIEFGLMFVGWPMPENLISPQIASRSSVCVPLVLGTKASGPGTCILISDDPVRILK